MKSPVHILHSIQRRLAAGAVLAVMLAVSQSPAFGQTPTLSVDFTVGGTGTVGTNTFVPTNINTMLANPSMNNIPITSGPGQTEDITIWLYVNGNGVEPTGTAPSGSPYVADGSNLGIFEAYFSANAAVTLSGGATLGGLTGAANNKGLTTGVGVTNYFNNDSRSNNTNPGPSPGNAVAVLDMGGVSAGTGGADSVAQNSVAAGGFGSFGDVNSTGINSLGTNVTTGSNLDRGTNAPGTALVLSPNASTNKVFFGGGSGISTYGGVAVGSDGWAFDVGTLVFTLPTVSQPGGSAVITFNPSNIPSSLVSGGITTEFTATAAAGFNNSAGGGTNEVTSNGTILTSPLTNNVGVTFTINGPAGGGNTSVLNLAPTTTSSPNSTTTINLGNLLSGAIVSSSATTNMTLASTASTTYSSSVSFNGGTAVTSGTGATTAGGVSGLVVTDSGSGSFSGSGSNTLGVSLNGAAPNGTDSWSYVATNVGNGSDAQGTNANKTVTISAVVGNATPDESGTGSFNGTVLSAPVGTGASYAGLSSSSNGGMKAANTAFPTQPGIEGSIATILAGTNTSFGTGTVSMTWRSRTLGETAQYDAVNNSPFTVNGTKVGGLPLISDVVDLFGMGTNSTQSSTTPVQTDPFVFQESFNPQTLKNEGATNATLATRGNVYLASLVSGAWVNTIIPDFQIPTANTTTTTYNGQTIQIGVDTLASMPSGISRPFEGTFAQWEAAFDPGLANPLSDYIGVWGVDAQTGTQFGVAGDGQYNAWAIINHNSDFAVVPEPSTIVLAGFGLLGGIWAMRRRRGLRLEA